ncbi:helix-turn-helix domain-containing protein [Lactiplantibacillus plantarum]|uniref:helix-turn-helix domain-containing protein n=1 Tax=Lactiplantibacillus plantarum TaxID=1590 RepID=UPI002877787E|nr:helix-turn-helix domain-containing protein [Lactiplantibacillus plantarum]WND32765.1 helix-turn-helix domain-containing protein [Lactiplantibacillus plantarum]
MQERQLIFLYHGLHFTIRWIARLLKRYPTTISRELRHGTYGGQYFPIATERLYHQ